MRNLERYYRNVRFLINEGDSVSSHFKGCSVREDEWNPTLNSGSHVGRANSLHANAENNQIGQSLIRDLVAQNDRRLVQPWSFSFKVKLFQSLVTAIKSRRLTNGCVDLFLHF